MSFEKLKERYEAGRITKAMLKVYVKKGVITAEEYKLITGEDYGGEVSPQPTPSENDEILNILLGEEA